MQARGKHTVIYEVYWRTYGAIGRRYSEPQMLLLSRGSTWGQPRSKEHKRCGEWEQETDRGRMPLSKNMRRWIRGQMWGVVLSPKSEWLRSLLKPRKFRSLSILEIEGVSECRTLRVSLGHPASWKLFMQHSDGEHRLDLGFMWILALPLSTVWLGTHCLLLCT